VRFGFFDSQLQCDMDAAWRACGARCRAGAARRALRARAEACRERASLEALETAGERRWLLARAGRELMARSPRGPRDLADSAFTDAHFHQLLFLAFAVRDELSAPAAHAMWLAVSAYDAWSPCTRPGWADTIAAHLAIAESYGEYMARAEARGLVRRPGAPDPADARGADVCVICAERPRDALVLPCRHLYACSECAARSASACAICRAPVHQVARVFSA
jgi:hypothetical protein